MAQVKGRGLGSAKGSKGESVSSKKEVKSVIVPPSTSSVPARKEEKKEKGEDSDPQTAYSFGYICRCGKAFFERRRYDYLKHLETLHGIRRKHPGEPVWIRWIGEGRSRVGIEALPQEAPRPSPKTAPRKRHGSPSQAANSGEDSGDHHVPKKSRAEVEKAKKKAAEKRKDEAASAPLASREVLTLEDGNFTTPSQASVSGDDWGEPRTSRNQWKDYTEEPSSEEETVYSPTCPGRDVVQAYSPQYLNATFDSLAPDLGEVPLLNVDLDAIVLPLFRTGSLTSVSSLIEELITPLPAVELTGTQPSEKGTEVGGTTTTVPEAKSPETGKEAEETIATVPEMKSPETRKEAEETSAIVPDTRSAETGQLAEGTVATVPEARSAETGREAEGNMATVPEAKSLEKEENKVTHNTQKEGIQERKELQGRKDSEAVYPAAQEVKSPQEEDMEKSPITGPEGCPLLKEEDSGKKGTALAPETKTQGKQEEGMKRKGLDPAPLEVGEDSTSVIPMDPKERAVFFNHFMERISCWSTVSSGPLEGTSWRARDNHRSVHRQRMPDNTVKVFMDSVSVLEPLVSSLTPPACSLIDMALRPKPIALGPTQFMQIDQETTRLKRRDDGVLEATKEFYVTFYLD